ncbi:hypothetical protein HF072_20665 [Bacillus sp. RO3]|nr:hypothetical protein [Bacillus sp. RO3]
MPHIHSATGNQRFEQKPFSIQNGRVLHINVHKLLGEGNAEVSANGQRFIAKLDTPLQAGERYWVEVKQSESGISLHLIATGQTKEGYGKQTAASLLDHLSISTNVKAMKELLVDLMKKNIPIQKDLLLFAEKHLTGAKTGEQMNILVEMAERNFPLSDRVFQSMKTGTAAGGFISMLNELTSKLMSTGRDMDTLQLLKGIQQPLNGVASEKLAMKALSGLMNPFQTFSNRLAHYDLLTSLGFLHKSGSMEQWKDGVRATMKEELKQYSPIQWGKRLELLSTELADGKGPASAKLRNDLDQLLSIVTGRGRDIERLSSAQVDKWLNVWLNTEALVSKGGERMFSMAAEELMNAVTDGKRKTMEMNYMRLLQSYHRGSPESNQERLFHKLHLQVEQELTNTIRGEELAKVLKRIIGTFGINFEAQMGKRGKDIQFHPSIKQYLIGLSQNHPLPDIRSLADDLVLKMNHQVLQSHETLPILTIVQQFPLYLFGQTTDVTLQWTGKEKAKGIIDEDYCRVLFYLELSSLKEILIDMQVQNRVVSLTVWTGHPDAETISRSFIPGLKVGLEKLEYHLSAVKVKTPDKQVSLSDKVISERFKTVSGVDLKI